MEDSDNSVEMRSFAAAAAAAVQLFYSVGGSPFSV